MSKTSHSIYLDDALEKRLRALYSTDKRAFKHNTRDAWVQKSFSEFIVELMESALDKEAVSAGSRLVLAGKVGEGISLKLDNLLLMLRVLIDVLSRLAKIPNASRDALFRLAAAE